jgi:hypothetical protein
MPEPLGHDVGRSIGARAAKGNVLLFIDGDMVIQARHLRPFVQAIASGEADVALNDYSGPTGGVDVHPVVLAKHALNIVLDRQDLKGTSLTAVPHAMNRHAIDTVGTDSLAVPPLAQAKAVEAGLRIKPVYHVNVGKKNRRRYRRERTQPLDQLIVGDHLEAIKWLTDRSGERGGCGDNDRNRHLVR